MSRITGGKVAHTSYEFAFDQLFDAGQSRRLHVLLLLHIVILTGYLCKFYYFVYLHFCAVVIVLTIIFLFA